MTKTVADPRADRPSETTAGVSVPGTPPVDTIVAEVQVEASATPVRSTWLLRAMQRGVFRQLEKICSGQLMVQYEGSSHVFGSYTECEPQATVTVHSGEFFRRVALNGSLGFAESYLLGEWSCNDLTNLVRVFCRNLHVADAADSGFVKLVKSVSRRWHVRHANSKENSFRNIHAHYDLGNDFYSQFLDETMTYSCGVFLSEKSTLREAQVEKIDRICRKLDLQPDDHLVEIGTGWGAFAIHAASQYGCRVTTTTISREQFEFAKQRVEEVGLGDRITLLLKDYRDLTGQFDKLATCEMIEAVGYEYFDTFFRKCGELLKPDGQMVLQGITMSEHRYERYLKQVDFIQRYIFPGGCLITPRVVVDSVTRTGDMRLVHLEDIAPHYVCTLKTWRDRFFSKLDDVRSLGFPESFIRLWEYYLCYCEAAFTERLVGTVQMHFARSECRVDPIS